MEWRCGARGDGRWDVEDGGEQWGGVGRERKGREGEGGEEEGGGKGRGGGEGVPFLAMKRVRG